MKTILGLDLGVSSIGWAVVREDNNNIENSKIIDLGVRVNPLTVDEQTDFEKGKPITTNAARTLARGARRNLQRFKLRRKNLIQVFIENNIIKTTDILTEVGKNTTFQTQELRAKSAKERIELNELARVLLLINKKRGYKSSRKVKNDDDGKIIDGMDVAKKLYEENLTPGQYSYQLLKSGKKHLPDFYRSDLKDEFDKVWNFQKQFYPEILTDTFKKELEGKGQKATSTLFWTKYNFNTADNKGKSREDKKLQSYKWRSEAITTQLEKEEVAFVIAEINNNLNNSSGYLGAISDRSKELYFNKQTVGEYLFQQIKKNPHTRLKNQVFYRQDYMDEFEKIWETQTKFHKELTIELKKEIRDIIIFYQRKLKSQKGLISFCELENKEITDKDGKKKIVGLKVAPKSSPLFQEFKIWQVLNNIEVKDNEGKRFLDLDEKRAIFEEVNIKGTISATKALEIIGFKANEVKMNYKNIEGNNTNKSFYEAYLKILEIEGYEVLDLLKIKSKDAIKLSDLDVSAREIEQMVQSIFKVNNIKTSVLDFNPELDGKDFEKQDAYQLWHLLYSYEGDNSPSGNEKLYELLEKKFGFKKEHAQILSNISLTKDYGSLSTKAMRKIFPYIKENKYSDACVLANYNHSKNSMTKEVLANRVLKDKLEILPKNSLRNPVVEKILNQMINLVNEIINVYGRPDEIRIELARELKKNAVERANMTSEINKTTLLHQKYAEILKHEFGIKYPSRNDIIRYKLYLELTTNGFKDFYTDTKIEKEYLFTNKYDIDHIIPQSRFFDDSYSNKVLVSRDANLKKGNATAFDFMETEGKERFEKFIKVITELYKNGSISKAKFEKLKKKGTEIGDGFIERDLRDTQYIAKKSKEILFQITNSVVSTSGSITDKLREDWGLINTMKELNFEKYKKLGLVETFENSKGEQKDKIVDWTKRNDHRHHAVDALTVAFTTHNHVQYLNYLNARSNENHPKRLNIINIENIITEIVDKKNGSKERKFKPPIVNIRQTAKDHLEKVLVSFKTKNKVVTKNKNRIKGKEKHQETLTPRGQLHKETIYGSAKFLQTKEVRITAKFDEDMINKVQNPVFRAALLKRLKENNADPKKAFSGKNAIDKNPIFIDEHKKIKLPESVKIAWFEVGYTIRKKVNPDNFKEYKNLEKITDKGVKDLLTKRLKEFDGNAKLAFSDLDKNPIWLNKEKGIAITTVSITGINNAESLHFKKDHLGYEILDENAKKIPVDFVSTGNNHHVAIYEDAEGNLQEKVVSFFEAVARVYQKLPIIDKEYNAFLGWKFLFSMKQNEMFLFPTDDFDPKKIDLFDKNNFKIISKNLFRVQKISTKDYLFSHQYESKTIDAETLKNRKELSGITYISIRTPSKLKGVQKVRINHIGKIVQIDEY